MQLPGFSEKIVHWYNNNKRDLPWRNSCNPYVIWLSEIILQQTRVSQGLPYFYKFIKTLPDITKFAEADEHTILKLWQGLGYYSRARNMHHAARQIVSDYKGKFPTSFDGLKQLKGVGDYTSAAIASFAFNQPYAVVDGNVYRFLSRCFGIDTPIDSTEGRIQFSVLANELLDKKNPSMHNQAIMEIGAMICKPQNPLCMECPVNSSCFAFAKNLVEELPVKTQKTFVRDRYMYYFFISCKSRVVIHRRTGNDIWKNMYDLPLIETLKKTPTEKIFKSKELHSLMGKSDYVIKKISPQVIHKLTHQKLYATFISIDCKNLNVNLSDDMEIIPLKTLSTFAFPRLIDNYFKKEKILSELPFDIASAKLNLIELK